MADGADMSVFAIADLHLGFAVNKPMDVFGDVWQNHPKKIETQWRKKVRDQDTVLLPGDISWGINAIQATPDLQFLNSLPGKKYISRGNHDYWWGSLNRVNQLLGSSFTAIQRNAVDCGEFILAASKGWNTPLWDGYKPNEDDKLYKRELDRMQIALRIAESLRKQGQKLVYMMHFPPVVNGRPSEFAETLSLSGVSLCIYGHLHGSWSDEVNMDYKGVRYRLVSADYLNFEPLDITTEVSADAVVC
jgi:predicted phosphohydrolase